MSDSAASVQPTDQLAVVQPNGLALATVGQVVASPMAQLSTLSATVVAQGQAIAALQGVPDPCQRFPASIAPATLQAGSTDVSVPVPGLLRTDVVSVEAEGDWPGGLTIGAFHPARDRDGVLLVQLVAGSLAITLKAALPITVVALR